MTHAEAIESAAGRATMREFVPRTPAETWVARVAAADASMTERAYWVLRASREKLIYETPATEPATTQRAPIDATILSQVEAVMTARTWKLNRMDVENSIRAYPQGIARTRAVDDFVVAAVNAQEEITAPIPMLKAYLRNAHDPARRIVEPPKQPKRFDADREQRALS